MFSLVALGAAYGDDDWAELAPGADGAKPVMDVFQAVTAAVQAKKADVIKGDLSRQYLESCENLKQFLTKSGDDTSHFDDGLLKDYGFYTLGAVKRVVVAQDVAFVEAPVVYKKSFVESRRTATAGKAAARSLANSMGGTAFDPVWEAKGAGTATFYFVRQGEQWKLHGTYFSAGPLTEDDLAVAQQFLETLAGAGK